MFVALARDVVAAPLSEGSLDNACSASRTPGDGVIVILGVDELVEYIHWMVGIHMARVIAIWSYGLTIESLVMAVAVDMEVVTAASNDYLVWTE